MFDIIEKENISIVKITGEIDISNAFDVKKFIHENILNKGEKYCILDFKNLSYIDSSGLGIIVGLHKTFKLQGGEIVLVNLNENIRKLFELTNLDRILNVKSTVEEGIKFLKE